MSPVAFTVSIGQHGVPLQPQSINKWVVSVTGCSSVGTQKLSVVELIICTAVAPWSSGSIMTQLRSQCCAAQMTSYASYGRAVVNEHKPELCAQFGALVPLCCSTKICKRFPSTMFPLPISPNANANFPLLLCLSFLVPLALPRQSGAC